MEIKIKDTNINYKFTNLFPLKVILIKCAFLIGLQSLKNHAFQRLF
jgi:hypothetical protein